MGGALCPTPTATLMLPHGQTHRHRLPDPTGRIVRAVLLTRAADRAKERTLEGEINAHPCYIRNGACEVGGEPRAPPHSTCLLRMGSQEDPL